MEKLFEKLKKQQLLSSVVTLAIGIILLVVPNLVAEMLVKIIGASLFIIGGTRVIFAATRKPPVISVYGIILAAIGLALVISSNFIVNAVNIILRITVGLLLAIYGINGVISALELKKNGTRAWIFHVVVSAVAIGAGVSSLLNSFNASGVFTQIIGAVMVISALCELFSLTHVKKLPKYNDEPIETEFEEKK